MINDVYHMPVVIQEIVRVANLEIFSFRRAVVDKQIIRTFHVAAFQKDEASGNGSTAFRVDAVDDFHAAGGIELQQRRGYGLHIFELRELVADLDGLGRAAEAEKNRGGGRLDHDVRVDSLNALGSLREKTGSEADNQHDKGDFYGDGHHANHGAQGAMEQVAHDEFAHHCGFSPGGFSSAVSTTRTSSVPAGCSSLKRSAGRFSFRVSLMISKSKR